MASNLSSTDSLGDETLAQVKEKVVSSGIFNMEELTDYKTEVKKSWDESKQLGKEKKMAGIFKQCGGCDGKGIKMCPGCFGEICCNDDCQENEWNDHKVKCKEVRKQFKEVIITPIESLGNRALNSISSIITQGEVVKKNFAVKIEVCDVTMSAWSKDLTVFGLLLRIPGQEEVYDQLRRQVLDQGQEVPRARKTSGKKYKAFFYSIYKGMSGEGKHRLEINPEQLLPMEAW